MTFGICNFDWFSRETRHAGCTRSHCSPLLVASSMLCAIAFVSWLELKSMSGNQIEIEHFTWLHGSLHACVRAHIERPLASLDLVALTAQVPLLRLYWPSVLPKPVGEPQGGVLSFWQAQSNFRHTHYWKNVCQPVGWLAMTGYYRCRTCIYTLIITAFFLERRFQFGGSYQVCRGQEYQ